MSENTERPPKGVILPWTSEIDPKCMGAHKFFDDPDYIGMDFERDDDGKNTGVSLEWAAKEMGMRATLFALRDVLTQGDYEQGSAFILRENAHTNEALNFFSRSNQHRMMIAGGGVIRIEGYPNDRVAEILEGDEDGSVHAFGFDNGELEISYQTVWTKTFHNIPSKGIFMFEKVDGALSRMVVDQCIAATGREGLLADVDQTLDEFSEYIPGLKR